MSVTETSLRESYKIFSEKWKHKLGWDSNEMIMILWLLCICQSCSKVSSLFVFFLWFCGYWSCVTDSQLHFLTHSFKRMRNTKCRDGRPSYLIGNSLMQIWISQTSCVSKIFSVLLLENLLLESSNSCQCYGFQLEKQLSLLSFQTNDLLFLFEIFTLSAQKIDNLPLFERNELLNRRS